MPIVRSRRDLQDFSKEIINCYDRFPEWYGELRSDLNNISFREAISLKKWNVVDKAINDLESAGEDKITNIPPC